jgi:hypothetical protein
MICTVRTQSEDIELGTGEVIFSCECDDGRCLLISGEFYERFQLSEILSQIGNQLANTAIEVERI